MYRNVIGYKLRCRRETCQTRSDNCSPCSGQRLRRHRFRGISHLATVEVGDENASQREWKNNESPFTTHPGGIKGSIKKSPVPSGTFGAEVYKFIDLGIISDQRIMESEKPGSRRACDLVSTNVYHCKCVYSLKPCFFWEVGGRSTCKPRNAEGGKLCAIFSIRWALLRTPNFCNRCRSRLGQPVHGHNCTAFLPYFIL